eukprot:114423-Rhodomonas_salina.1
MSRGTKKGELTETSGQVQSLQELANSALKPARDDNGDTSRETTSRQLLQRAQKLGAITDKPPPAPTEQRIRARQYKSWTSEAQVPLDVEIDLLRDAQLGRCLARHCFVFKLPTDWAPATWKLKQDGFVMVRLCTGSKGNMYLECDVLSPREMICKTLQLPVSKPKLFKKQIEAGLEETYRWLLLGLLDTLFHEPTTLADTGLAASAVRDESADVSRGGSTELNKDGPFADQDRNEIWHILASQMLEGYEALADIDMLEPDPANHTQAMKNPLLRPFWIESQNKEIKGLWDNERTDNRVFGLHFHYHIK